MREYFKNLPDQTTPLKKERINGLLNGQESIEKLVVGDIESKNKFNTELINGVYIYGTGDYVSTDDYICSKDFTEVTAGTTICLSYDYGNLTSNGARFLFYSADGTHISDSENNVAVVPTDATKCMFNIQRDLSTSSISPSEVTNVQIEKGTVATPYSEYKGIGYTSGSNEYGSWVKYDDGRMECYKTLSTYADAQNQWGALYETSNAVQLGNTPQNFVGDIPKVVVTIHDVDWFIESIRDTSLTSYGNIRLALPISTTNRKVVADIVAYGRWK